MTEIIPEFLHDAELAAWLISARGKVVEVLTRVPSGQVTGSQGRSLTFSSEEKERKA